MLLKYCRRQCTRGGVKYTRLEAKAKDSFSEDRPSRGQGQECSRTKDTAASVLQKKKGLQNIFSGNHQFIGVARIFDWGGLNHKSHAMTSSKICLLALNQDFAKREGFPVNMLISDQYCLRAVLYCVYRCCLANIETTLGLFYKTHISEIRKILLNCFISQFNFIRHSYLHVLISVLSKDKCYYTILCKNCSILSKQYRITNTEKH